MCCVMTFFFIKLFGTFCGEIRWDSTYIKVPPSPFILHTLLLRDLTLKLSTLFLLKCFQALSLISSVFISTTFHWRNIIVRVVCSKIWLLNPGVKTSVPYCTKVTNRRRANQLYGQCYCTPQPSNQISHLTSIVICLVCFRLSQTS